MDQESPSPSTSRDGSRIAFTSDRDGPTPPLNFEVYVMDTDGTNQERFTKHPTPHRKLGGALLYPGLVTLSFGDHSPKLPDSAGRARDRPFSKLL
jgi:hypothetical protein